MYVIKYISIDDKNKILGCLWKGDNDTKQQWIQNYVNTDAELRCYLKHKDTHKTMDIEYINTNFHPLLVVLNNIITTFFIGTPSS